MRAPRLRLSLLGKFVLVSTIPIVLLGVVLAVHLRSKIEQDALSDAVGSATLIAGLIFEPRLRPTELADPLPADQLASFDRAFEAARLRVDLARITVWSPEGRVVYSDDSSIVGKAFPLSAELSSALNGTIASSISGLEDEEEAGERGFGRLIEVYVPLRAGSASRPVGALELFMPYDPIEAATEESNRELYVLLFGGLALLYISLFPLAARMSRKLRRQAAQNEYQALHDNLTSLPNRTLFRDRLDRAILGAKRDGSGVAVIILDVDRFKEVNDTLGHQNGDLLLQQVGVRIQRVLRESDTIARLGGDEFAVLLRGTSDVEGPVRAAQRIQGALEQPFLLRDLSLSIEASIGIAIYPDHGQDVDTLIQRADVAMYVAKDGHSQLEVYEAERDRYTPGRLALLGELRRAIDQHDLVLHYQPEAELQDGTVQRVEALVRWQHQSRGLIPPDEFIPLAERTGLIRALTLYVLNEALGQVHRWRQEGFDLSVGVNLSARNLHDPTLPDEVQSLLNRWEVPASHLKLEITESAILSDPVRAGEVLSRLNEMGVRLSIDDFGTGYSSLAHLRRLPVDEIKIDRTFVMNMNVDENDAVIVRSTIELGRNLGLQVVAEGVETEEIWAELVALGCDLAQGFYLSRPVPPEVLTSWLAESVASSVLTR